MGVQNAQSTSNSRIGYMMPRYAGPPGPARRRRGGAVRARGLAAPFRSDLDGAGHGTGHVLLQHCRVGPGQLGPRVDRVVWSVDHVAVIDPTGLQPS